MSRGHDIEADFDTLVDQAGKAANTYMLDAIHFIDEQFGKGFAANNVPLLVAFMQTAAADFHHTLIKLAAQDIRDGIRDLA